MQPSYRPHAAARSCSLSSQPPIRLTQRPHASATPPSRCCTQPSRRCTQPSHSPCAALTQLHAAAHCPHALLPPPPLLRPTQRPMPLQRRRRAALTQLHVALTPPSRSSMLPTPSPGGGAWREGRGGAVLGMSLSKVSFEAFVFPVFSRNQEKTKPLTWRSDSSTAHNSLVLTGAIAALG